MTTMLGAAANPNIETRNPKQIPMKKKQIQNELEEECRFAYLHFLFRICFVFRISIFEFCFGHGQSAVPAKGLQRSSAD
jgi:hypothetical protein